MPQIRTFRALRFDPRVVGDLNGVVCPPYDVIGPELHRTLLARSPYNADAWTCRRSRRARSRTTDTADCTLAGRLARGSHAAQGAEPQHLRLRADLPGSRERPRPLPSVASSAGRLRLEDLKAGSGVRPHERTLSAPKEDRYKLLRAMGVNTSPVVGLFADPDGKSVEALEALAANPPDADVTDDDGVHHRLWAVAENGPGSDRVTIVLDAAGRAPTIANGHGIRRYETALQYRDQRRANRTGEADSLPPST